MDRLLIALWLAAALVFLPSCEKEQDTTPAKKKDGKNPPAQKPAETSPERKPLILTSQAQENKLGEDAYKDVLSKEKRSTDAQATAMLERVGKRLAAAAPDMGFKYEFVLLESKTVNAFCLPGGKVAVYTGILPYCQDEAGLATVLGHEIAHAIARHGGERMTQGMVAEGLGAGLDLLLKEGGASDTARKLAGGAYGAGAQVGILLPYSRKHELEADYLGLQYMSKAGYDPRLAPEFWKRFASAGSNVPTFLSTHPNSADRAEKLGQAVPAAMALYEASAKYGAGERVPAKYAK